MKKITLPICALDFASLMHGFGIMCAKEFAKGNYSFHFSTFMSEHRGVEIDRQDTSEEEIRDFVLTNLA